MKYIYVIRMNKNKYSEIFDELKKLKNMCALLNYRFYAHINIPSKQECMKKSIKTIKTRCN